MANEFKIRKGLIVEGASGGTVVDVQGSQGQLFSVTDDLSGSNIFGVSDISGVPILQCGVDFGYGNVSIDMSFNNGYTLNVGSTANGSIITQGRIFCGDDLYIQSEAIFADGPVMVGLTSIGTTSAKVVVKGNQSFGLPGVNNTNGRYLSIEGNADGAAEGSGRIFFTEHNSTTAGMDNYGMSLGYRGGSTSIVGASGNTWTGLTQIGNGQWGMFGHDNSAPGALIMSGDRAATYVEFHSNDIKGAGDIYVADQIIHTGDTNTYMQFHAADQWRVVTGGSERLEVNNSATTVSNGNLIVNNSAVIGATSPGSNKLRIVGNTAKLEGSGSGYTAWFITNSGTGNAGTYYDAINGDVAGGDYGFIGQHNSGYMFYTIGTASPMPFHVFTGGNVGIGTTSPAGTLDVLRAPTNYAVNLSDTLNRAGLVVKSSGTFDSKITFSSGASSRQYIQATNNAATTGRDIAINPYGGNVGVGTSSPGQKLTVNGRVLIQNSTTPFYIKVNSGYKSWVHHIASNDTYVMAPSTADGGETWDWANQTAFSISGVVTANNFVLSSDKRNKTKIEDLTGDTVDISWKSFEMKGNKGEYRTGVIAQELEENYPEFVNTDDRGFKSVKYIDLLIAKIAELEARLEKLEK